MWIIQRPQQRNSDIYTYMMTSSKKVTPHSKFPLNKSRVVLWLTKGLLMTPGPLDLNRSYRLCSPQAFLCIVGMAITLVNVIVISLKKGPPPPLEEGHPMKDGCFPPGPPPNRGNNTGKPSVVVDIAIGSFQFLGFIVNIVVRIGAVVAFPKIRQILHCLQTKDKTDVDGNHRWGRSWTKWTIHEKIYLGIMTISLFAREFLSSGVHILEMMSPCTRGPWFSEIVLLVQEQSMVVLSLELILEVATFLLLAFMGTFTHSLELELECKQRNAQEPLTVHLEELLLHPYTRKVVGQLPRKIEDLNRSEMERLLHSYFDMIAVWGHAADCTGFLTLLIFTDHTLSFCLNIFIAIASLSRFGMDGHFFIGVTTASIGISKLICVAYMAQMLPDATTKLADRVQELNWKRKNTDNDDDDNLTQVIDYVRNHPLKLSALGYFTVSKATLTSICGVVVTYLVVLVQFHVQTLQQQNNINEPA